MFLKLANSLRLEQTKNLFKKTFTILTLAVLALGGVISVSMLIGANSIKSQAAGTPNYTTSNKKFFKDGQEVVFKGVNWFGFETDNAVFHGLWTNRSANTQLDQMKSLGFNTIRLPVCPGVLTNKNIGGVDFSANPDLNGLNSQQALDLMMQKIAAKGMYILLDHHRPDCNSISEYWYTGGYSETQWINDLKSLATRYASNPNFIGLDIKNEPHGAVTWNQWKGATERAGQAILAVNPNIVIYTEGVSTTNAGGNCNSSFNAWWGGNIKGQLCDPISTTAIPSNKLAFVPHVYGPDVYGQPYFNDPTFANMPAIWDDHFGNVLATGNSVALGEFGGKYGAGDSRDVAWQNKVVDYQIAKGMCSFFFWSWNPNSGDTGGILNDDWTTVSTAKYTNLKRLIDAPNCQGGAMASSSSPVSSTVSSLNNSTSSIPLNTEKLLNYAKAKGIKLGAAIKNEYLNEINYVNTATSEFDSFTSEYAMKPDQWWSGISNYNFTEGDKLADLAKSKGIQMRGHTTIWYQTEPGWLTNSNFTTQQYRDLLRQGVYDYIKHYTDKYPGMFYAWDVVNEMVQDGGSGALRTNNFWYNKLGNEMFNIAFQAARDASPSAKLVLNDYNIEMTGAKANGVIGIINQLKQAGVPIDGVGIQSHFEVGNEPNYQSFVDVINQFKATGVQVELTEVDMRGGDQNTKATRTYNAVKACLVTGCKGITFWGVTDKYSWLGSENGLLFDANYAPKPMYTQAIQAFKDFGTVPTSSSSLSTSSVVSSSSSSNPPIAPGCFQVTTNRQMGGDNWYNLELSLRNGVAPTLTNWELTFDLPGAQTIQSGWNNSYNQNGRTVKVTIPGSSIAPNETKDLGGLTIVNAQGTSNTLPTVFNLTPNLCPVTSSSSSSTVNSSVQSSVASSVSSTSANGNLKLKVNLQGAYNTSTNIMRTDLKNKNLISNDDPYDENALVSPNPITTTNAVDWVKIIVQNTQNLSLSLVDAGGLLLSDGNIIMDPLIPGSTNNTRTLQPGKYKITIKHRNHLAITTNTDIDIVAGQTTTLDFTTNQNVKGGNQAMLKPGVYGLKMGNTDGNGRINSLDRIALRLSPDRTNVMSLLDINMDGNISAIDRILSRSIGDSIEQL